MQLLRRARHIPQIDTTLDPVRPPLLRGRHFPPWNHQLEYRHDDGFVMEYFPSGSLSRWMKLQVAQPGPLAPFPEEALWLIFRCLTQGCIAMAYPPRIQGQPRQREVGTTGRFNFNEAGAMLPEQLPARATARAHANVVHLDIDTSNILVGPFQDPDLGGMLPAPGFHDHTNMPMHKVGIPALELSSWPPILIHEAIDIQHTNSLPR
jgi:serine/threonine protein kinase